MVRAIDAQSRSMVRAVSIASRAGLDWIRLLAGARERVAG
jgi:hypothetical protein